jgi:hypothetical protein
MKEVRLNGVRFVKFHQHKVQEQEKLISGDENQKVDVSKKRTIWKETGANILLLKYDEVRGGLGTRLF